jgi:GAF domain-containing protein
VRVSRRANPERCVELSTWSKAGEHVDADDVFSKFALDFSDTTRTLFTAGSVREIVDGIVELAVSTIEGCDFAALFLTRGGVVTSVDTDPAIQAIEAREIGSGEGPGVDAVAHQRIIYVDNLADEVRWPNFAPLAHEAGIRSLLSLPVSSDFHAGALSLYSRYPAAFDVHWRARALILVTLASFALSAAHTREDDERRLANYVTALASREMIGQATGILIERKRITAEQAFVILRHTSQHYNVKLREVARHLIETGEILGILGP